MITGQSIGLVISAIEGSSPAQFRSRASGQVQAWPSPVAVEATRKSHGVSSERRFPRTPGGSVGRGVKQRSRRRDRYAVGRAAPRSGHAEVQPRIRRGTGICHSVGGRPAARGKLASLARSLSSAQGAGRRHRFGDEVVARQIGEWAIVFVASRSPCCGTGATASPSRAIVRLTGAGRAKRSSASTTARSGKGASRGGRGPVVGMTRFSRHGTAATAR